MAEYIVKPITAEEIFEKLGESFTWGSVFATLSQMMEERSIIASPSDNIAVRTTRACKYFVDQRWAVKIGGNAYQKNAVS